MPRILVVNDDGVDSEGIVALAEALCALGEVTVVAPDGDRSATSHAISTRRTIAVRRLEDRTVPTYACSGSPADCVVLGTTDLAGGPVDLVASGINRGANLGDDVNYSGTVAAGIEGVLMGARAIAVSLAASWPQMDAAHAWTSAAHTARDLARDVLAGNGTETLWNLNVPNVPQHAGVRYTRLGRKRYRDRIERGDPPQLHYAYVWGTVEAEDDSEATDLGALRRGFATVTPLRVDRTDYAALEARGLIVAPR